MPRKQPHISDDSTVTVEHALNKSGQVMDDMRTAAANLDAHINAVRKGGFFELEQPIVLARNGLSELGLDKNGKLVYSPEITIDDYGDPDEYRTIPQKKQVTGPPKEITALNAAKIFNVKECVRNLHTALDEWIIVAKRKREESEIELERVVMRPDPPKSLPSKRK